MKSNLTSSAKDTGPLGHLTFAGDDAIVPFQVDALDIRGRAVQLGPMLDEILDRHAYPEPVSRLLSEAVTLTALLGSSLKFEGKFILQTQTDGPVSMIVVDFKTPGDIRAYARYNEAAVVAADANGENSTEQLLGKGVLAMTIDQGQHMQRYQGIVQLDGTSLEEVARQYFRQSEQIPTDVRLAVAQSLTRDAGKKPLHNWRAGGLLIQFLPDSTERMRQNDLPSGNPDADEQADRSEDDCWNEARALLGTTEEIELTDPEIPSERLLLRLFNQYDVRVHPSLSVSANCSCSQDGIRKVLEGFTRQELSESVKDGEILVNCEFCSTGYRFDPEAFIAKAD